MKILAVYDRGVGAPPTVLIEATASEVEALTGRAPVVGDGFDLPPLLADASAAQALADQLRAVVDRIAPQALGVAKVG